MIHNSCCLLGRWSCVLLFGWLLASAANGDEPRKLKLLFLGDNGHHQPAARFQQLQPVLSARGIELTYSDQVADVNGKTLSAYDGLIVYANTTKLEANQEQALLDFVEGGKGFIPLHCASYCFLNSPAYVDLVGAQFQKHGTGVFRTKIVAPDHPLMKSFRGFESWDETYVHTRHNEKDRTVLETREEAGGQEPWTWVRTQGKGRVFYTAWGHDERTWGSAGFQNLVERGIRWAVGADPGVVPPYADAPEMTAQRKDVKPFEFVEANVPFYPAGQNWGKLGEAIKQMQKPLDPAESAKHYVTPQGFEMRLFAAEPQIGKPICMNWDERGRLWIAETVDYPNEKQSPGKGRDRIRICEDTDGDGRADKFTVFAEQLSIPTSLILVRGGVVVHQAPETLFLKDTNGDDVADERRVLFTGWSTADTHAGPSNLRYGLDNWLYGMVGYAGFEGEIGGERQSFRTGFYRFRPDGAKFEFLRNTNNNSWGVGFSEEGILFGSTANGNPSEYMPIPNRYYEAVRGWSSTVLGGIAQSNKFAATTDKIRQVDHHGGFTAAAGHALYTARNYPREYWNRAAFVCEPTAHLAATFLISGEGAGFRSRNAWNLAASDDEWSAPIMAEVGPDGNVWILDWYNYIVQHNPIPEGFKVGKGNAYETDLRDKKHGRIYRLVYLGEGEKAAAKKNDPPFTLAGATPARLVETLKNNNMFWRLQAQRLLVERENKDVVPALIALTSDSNVDELGLNVGAMHALATLHGLGALNGSDATAVAAATTCLKHKNAGVRRLAIQSLPKNLASLAAILACGVLQDAGAQVRLAALLALAEMPSTPAAGEAAAQALTDPGVRQDRWLLDAATSAAARHAPHVLEALVRLKSADGAQPALDRVSIVSEHFARGGDGAAVAHLADSLAAASPPVVDAILTGLSRGWPKDKRITLDPATEESLLKMVASASPAARAQLVMLAKRWGSEKLQKYSAEIAQGFLAQAADEKLPDAARVTAAVQVIDFARADAEIVKELLGLLSPRTSPELAQGMIEAVSRSEAAEAGPALLESLGAVTPAARAVAIRALLSRGEWTQSLLTGIEEGKIRLGELSLDQKQALSTHPNKAIAERAKKLLASGGGLPNPDRQKVLEQLLPLTKKSGDAEKGKLVFKNQCAKCHTHSGEGNKIGPDLTGMAVHPKAELLMNVIDPSRSVEGNFRVYTVLKTDGVVLTGLLASETKTAIEIFDAEGKKQTVLREDIEKLQASPKSLMPEGFEKQVSPDEIVNLLEFLTRRGRFTPLSLAKAATVVSTRGMFYSLEADEQRLIFSDWSPKTVEGVPFQLVDPQGERIPNAILLYSRNGNLPPKMPKSVTLPCNAPAKAIHFLSGVSGWGFPLGEKGSVTMIVRLHYADGKTEDHPLKNGEHFADYIRRVDVPNSKFAFELRGQQLRFLSVIPQRPDEIKQIELVKGPDATAPIVMAITVEALK